MFYKLLVWGHIPNTEGLGSRIYDGTENLISEKIVNHIMLLIHCEIVLLESYGADY